MEERRRGEEEHVPPGRHRLAAVRGFGCFRERPGTGREGGERVELPSLSPPLGARQRLLGTRAHLSTVQTPGEAAVVRSRRW